MLPRAFTLSHKTPSVLFKRDLIPISRHLTVDISNIQRLFETLGPIAIETIDVYGLCGDLSEDDRCVLLTESLKAIWESKEELRKKDPGSYIVDTILNKVRLFFKEKGWDEKWQQVVQRLRHDYLLED